MGKKVLAAKSGRAACPNAAGGGIGAKNAKGAKSFLTGLTGFTGLREASVKPAKTKPSGVAWIGDIPDGWKMMVGKHVYTVQAGAPFDSTKFSNVSGFPLVRIRDITSGKSETYYTGDYEAKDVVHDGDLLVGMDGDFHVRWWQGGEALLNQRCCKIQPRDVITSRFAYYFLPFALADINAIAYATTVKHLSNWDLENVRIPLPPLSEQRAIADYLDEKCGAIDAAIAEAKKGIEEYKAWKISLIDDVVCNGIVRHDVRKETGEVWLEDIPGEWDFTQIRYLFALRDERNDKPLKDVNLISLYTDKGVVQHADLEKTTGNKASTADGYKLVYENDIVVNIILCWMGAVGRSAYNGVTSPAYDVYRPIDPTKVLSRYYHYLFRSPRFNGKCYEEGRGIMMMRWRTYSSEFRAIKVPVPPFEEQQAIADYLDEKCAAIDAMIAEKEALIADLEAYKKSLIYEVVTGKREVASNSMVK